MYNISDITTIPGTRGVVGRAAIRGEGAAAGTEESVRGGPQEHRRLGCGARQI